MGYKKIGSIGDLRERKMWMFGRRGASASGFSSSSTAEEVARGIDASALTAIVTGSSSGIGIETSRVLALCGVHVIMGVRNVERGNKVKESIRKDNPEAKIDVMELDLASFASIHKFASNYNSSALPLNILINNAGVLAQSFALSKDNIELHFATNHLGHFLLTKLLLDTMEKTARERQIEGRIVNVTSSGHMLVYPQGIRFDKINEEYSSYFFIPAYGQSKLANILHANELARRFKEAGVKITANSVHPGFIATDLFREEHFFQGLVNRFGKYFMKDISQGAATTCYVALHPQVMGVSGEYFANCNICTPSQLALDAELAKKLWDFSSNITQP